MKNCSLAWPNHSSRRALLVSASDSALCRRKVWLILHSRPLFPVDRAPKAHQKCVVRRKNGAGYTKIRSGHARLEELQLKEANMQSIPYCKD